MSDTGESISISHIPLEMLEVPRYQPTKLCPAHSGVGRVKASPYVTTSDSEERDPPFESSDKTVPLLVPPPYDDVYRAFIQLKTDMKQNDTYDAGNSQRLFWQAYNEFARFWNSTHMPINKTPYRGYKE